MWGNKQRQGTGGRIQTQVQTRLERDRVRGNKRPVNSKRVEFKLDEKEIESIKRQQGPVNNRRVEFKPGDTDPSRQEATKEQ